jgi:hypothetical protein
MTLPADDPIPGFEACAEIVAKSSNEELEQIRQHALRRMHSLLQGGVPIPREYVEWSDFVDEIKVEQHRRGLDKPN